MGEPSLQIPENGVMAVGLSTLKGENIVYMQKSVAVSNTLPRKLDHFSQIVRQKPRHYHQPCELNLQSTVP